MNRGDTVTVTCLAGEVVGKLESIDGDRITLKDPRVITPSPDGSRVGFAKGISFAGKLNPTEVTINNFIFVTEIHPDFEREYIKTVTGLVV